MSHGHSHGGGLPCQGHHHGLTADGEAPSSDAIDPSLLHATRLASFARSVRLGESAFGGRGLFAARAFSAGEEILQEPAVCWGVPDASVSTTLEEDGLAATLLQMAPYCWSGDAPPPPLPAGGLPALIAATMKANAWGCRAAWAARR